MSRTGLRKHELAVVVAVLGATAAAGAARYLGAPPLLAFVLATAALAGLAWIVGFATEQVGEQFGPAVTGVMQTTLGNLPELFIVLFALSAGKTVVAQTSIIGSLFANALLVLGLVIIAGARASGDGVMRFEPRLPNDTVTLLILATFVVVVIGISAASSDKASQHATAISIAGSVVLLVSYGFWVVPYLRSGRAETAARATPRVPLGVSIALLTAGGAGAGFVSDWFVTALTPSIDRLHISQAFAGIVIVAIAGNAVENVAGIMLAAKGQSDLAISVVKNSVSQVIAFLFPLLVLISLFFTNPLTFAFAPVFVGALALTALAVWQISGDGKAAYFEGVALVGIYVVLAVVALYE